MNATEQVVGESAASTPTEVLSLLSQILALPQSQRQSLGVAWAAMDPAISLGGLQHADLGAPDVGQPAVVDPVAVEKLNAWIQEQGKLPPRERINALQVAIDEESEAWPIPLLNAEIIKIKNANPWIAAEFAVVKYAYEHPVLIFVALSGLGLALYKFGKAALALVF